LPKHVLCVSRVATKPPVLESSRHVRTIAFNVSLNRIAYTVHFLFCMSSLFSGAIQHPRGKQSAMPVVSLYDSRGGRKYLTSQERRAFAMAALRSAPPILTFCLTLLYTGARVSELLALTPERIDRANNAIIFETLKRRRRGVFRAIPVPPELVTRVMQIAHRQQSVRRSCTGAA
jgi:integrase